MAHPPHDEILTAISYYQRPMKFRARIFHSQPMTIALLTDLGNGNPGLSITNGIEYAVRAVFNPWPDIKPARLVIVEHYG